MAEVVVTTDIGPSRLSNNLPVGAEKGAGPRRLGTLTETVAARIRDMILEGRYEPGSALPEMTLAEELQTSRGTMREALRKIDMAKHVAKGTAFLFRRHIGYHVPLAHADGA